MIADFRRQEHSLGKTIIHNNEVEIVGKYKYLGTIFDDKLKWDDNTKGIVKKGQQRLYLLRKLNYFSVDQKILTLFFFTNPLLSVLSFSFICWFHSLGVKNRNSQQRIVRIASKITAVPQRPGSFLWTADITESPLYFNEEGPYFKLGIYYSPIRSLS